MERSQFRQVRVKIMAETPEQVEQVFRVLEDAFGFVSKSRIVSSYPDHQGVHAFANFITISEARRR